ncbi:hypothetical protein RRX38_03240 [Pseudomonas sp. DTU_2021_1001937_2_SI_NGA_ILE_001]|uniref:hypothetical protein n=1 Tax=Pseudomonas sp. DTU_2021_1001937_2_SI_NGA_ILE_001 TaxID=3077589 RepID=UPI0028FC0EA7|nr:hypothetical protein [Pseudomonas sp. DTU_2021_1001937_2_SI_NGA_ILE_001]WNW10203.1 hypothetical protein RRX38_03240 [Pseudomonas sp. DTU_2021_1001937_2_SI_NGA_ILE_001]
MPLTHLSIPETIKTEAVQILADLENANGLLEMSQLAGVAEGFTRALGCVKALPQAELDTLERVFTSAVSRRMAALRG